MAPKISLMFLASPMAAASMPFCSSSASSALLDFRPREMMSVSTWILHSSSPSSVVLFECHPAVIVHGHELRALEELNIEAFLHGQIHIRIESPHQVLPPDRGRQVRRHGAPLARQGDLVSLLVKGNGQFGPIAEAIDHDPPSELELVLQGIHVGDHKRLVLGDFRDGHLCATGNEHLVRFEGGNVVCGRFHLCPYIHAEAFQFVVVVLAQVAELVHEVRVTQDAHRSAREVPFLEDDHVVSPLRSDPCGFHAGRARPRDDDALLLLRRLELGILLLTKNPD